MSDAWLVVLPVDPEYRPTPEQRLAVERALQSFFPGSDVTSEWSDVVAFHDCGVNFERVVCPSCGADLMGAWPGLMSNDFNGAGFRLMHRRLPCCSASHTLNELRYEAPQGFSHYVASAMNPNENLDDDTLSEVLTSAMGCQVRLIRRHL